MRALAWFAAAAAALVVAVPAVAGLEDGIAYLAARQQPDGGFAEPGRASDPSLTAWVVLGLAAAGRPPEGTVDYLAGKPYPAVTDLELRILALRALGENADQLAGRLQSLQRPSGAIGPAINSTIWGVLALRSAGRPVTSATIGYLLRHQAPSGGWSWLSGVAPDADDTAAAVQALRAAGVPASSRPIRRALAYLRRLQNRDGGFALTAGQASNTQSTAWAVQAFAAAQRQPPFGAIAFLERMQRKDGSFRYSSRYVTTPVWVTAYALAALARRPFPVS